MESSAPPRRHVLRWVVVGVLGTLSIVLGGAVLLFTTREDPDAKDVDDAVEEYRATSVPTSVDALDRPAAGVYRAEGTGREDLSFPPLSQEDGETLPITVEHLAEGCWRLTVDFNEAHWQQWDYCTRAGRVVEQAGTTFQRWDLGATTIESLAEFVCEPPNLVFDPTAVVDDSWSGSCTGTNSAIEGSTVTAGPTTYLGPEVLEIDGEPVDVQHYRQALSVTGAQEGTNDVDAWYDATNGLPVRMERATEVATDSPVGAITYQEAGEWQLTSLRPVG
jgi:hypothetical protein